MMIPKVKTYRSKKYREYIRSLDCCSCGWPSNLGSIECHHVVTGGISIKGADSLCVPLCGPSARGCHAQADKCPQSVEKYKPIAEQIFRRWNR